MSALPGERVVRSSLEEVEKLVFEAFTLDASTLELRRDGEPVPLAPQPARLLHALASRPGTLLTRDELRRIVWGDDTFVDFERGLNFCILQVRTALGDDARNPLFIETLPKRGYRFIAEVRAAGAPRTLSMAAAPEAEPPAESRTSPLRLFVAVSVTLVVLATLLMAVRSRSASPDPALTSTSPQAHEAYVRGRQLYQQIGTPAVQASVLEFRKAIAAEPAFALPHVALAESLHALAMRERLEPQLAAKEMREATTEALRLAPDYDGSHATAAMLQFWYEWDWDAAEGSYERAIALNPRNAGALHDHGWLRIVRGDFEGGIAEIRRAQELEPTSPRANAHVAWAYIYSRRYADAIREARRALELDPEFVEAFACLETAYRLSGNPAAAEQMRIRRGGLADPGDGRDFYANAVRHLRLGDRDGAISWLERARAVRNTSIPLAGVDPKLEGLHGDTRFQSLLTDLGLAIHVPR
jgi:DNA-binding winged helix-turn-helix (wHTH) protein